MRDLFKRHRNRHRVLFLLMRSMQSVKAVIPAMAAAMIEREQTLNQLLAEMDGLILQGLFYPWLQPTDRKFWIKRYFVRDVLTVVLSSINRI